MFFRQRFCAKHNTRLSLVQTNLRHPQLQPRVLDPHHIIGIVCGVSAPRCWVYNVEPASWTLSMVVSNDSILRETTHNKIAVDGRGTPTRLRGASRAPLMPQTTGRLVEILHLDFRV